MWPHSHTYHLSETGPVLSDKSIAPYKAGRKLCCQNLWPNPFVSWFDIKICLCMFQFVKVTSNLNGHNRVSSKFEYTLKVTENKKKNASTILETGCFVMSMIHSYAPKCTKFMFCTHHIANSDDAQVSSLPKCI